MASPFLYMTLAVDKLNGSDISNTVHCECLPKKAKVTNTGLPGSTNKSERFNYIGE